MNYNFKSNKIEKKKILNKRQRVDAQKQEIKRKLIFTENQLLKKTQKERKKNLHSLFQRIEH